MCFFAYQFFDMHLFFYKYFAKRVIQKGGVGGGNTNRLPTSSHSVSEEPSWKWLSHLPLNIIFVIIVIIVIIS